MTGTERQYDEIIAPMLLAVAKRCEELGMSIVARVEWAPGESGITQNGIDGASIDQKLTHLAAHSHGNIDGMLIAAIKNFDCSQSVMLRNLVRKALPHD